MRVLYVVSLFPCWSETFIVREIREMVALGVDVRILSLRHPSEAMVQSDAQALLDRVIYPPRGARALAAALRGILRAPLRELGALFFLATSLARHPALLAKTLVAWWRTLAAGEAIAAASPAHIHAHFATFPSTAAWLLSRRHGVPFSFTAHAHDIFLEDHMLGRKLRAASFVACISEFNHRFLQARVPAAANDARVEIVHCGVPLESFAYRPDGREAASLLAIGRLDGIKGFPHLVDACALLARRGVAFTCDVIGDGPLRGALERRIAEAGLEGRVRLMGARKQEEVRARLATATAFVLPSVVTPRGDRDGIPVALMEAMACGLPVVSTRVSGIPELVEDGTTGLLADPGDAHALAGALERLLADPALRARLARAARQRIEAQFDVRAETRKLHQAMQGRHAAAAAD